MSAEVDFVLAQFASIAGSTTVPLRRVDRDESRILEGDIRKRKADLTKANYVGATLVDRSPSPIGGEYDHAVETVVGIRIEGLHADKYGYVDPDGVEGIPFGELVKRCKNAVLAERNYPAVTGADPTYHTLFVENESPQSSNYRDFFRTDFDVRFDGYETLP